MKIPRRKSVRQKPTSPTESRDKFLAITFPGLSAEVGRTTNFVIEFTAPFYEFRGSTERDMTRVRRRLDAGFKLIIDIARSKNVICFAFGLAHPFLERTSFLLIEEAISRLARLGTFRSVKIMEMLGEIE